MISCDLYLYFMVFFDFEIRKKLLWNYVFDLEVVFLYLGYCFYILGENFIRLDYVNVLCWLKFFNLV